MTSEHRPPCELVLDTMELAGIGHARTDRDGVILFASPSFIKMGQLDEENYPTAPWFKLDSASAARKEMRAIVWNQFISRRAPWHGIVHWHLSEDKVHFFEGTATHMDDDTVVLVMNDRTSKILADKKVEDTITLYSQVLRDLPMAVAVTDLDGRVTYINDFLPRRLGRAASSFHGKTLTESFGNSLTELADEVLQNYETSKDNPEGLTLELIQKKGVGTWLVFARPLFDIKGKHVATLNLAIDRTESHKLRIEHARLTETMHEAQKISALNDFAGNLAHELSNILHPVAFYARKLNSVSTKEQCSEYASRVNKGVMTAGQILRRTLSLTGRENEPPAPRNILAILEETLISARDLAPKGLTYVAHLPDAPVMAEISRSGFSQVLLNLFNNAAEAMGHKGTITITLDTVTDNIPEDLVRQGRNSAIRLTVEDEGPGIDPDVADRLFDAFFTTKSPGTGVGLGLAVVKSLVTSWGGTVSAQSQPGVGAAFSIWLPEPVMK